MRKFKKTVCGKPSGSLRGVFGEAQRDGKSRCEPETPGRITAGRKKKGEPVAYDSFWAWAFPLALPIACAASPVQAFKNFGYEMPDTEAQDEKETIFQWQDSNNERYETFGFIESGDRVRVEKSPIIQDGNVIKKGLVKKARN